MPASFAGFVVFYAKVKITLAWGLGFIDYIRQPSFIYIESVFVSLFLMPIILLALLMSSWINPIKYRKRIIDESITTDQQGLYIRFCNAYRHSIIGEILYRFFYLILPAILPALIIFILFLGEWFSQLNSRYSGDFGQSGWDGPGLGLLTDHLNYILFILLDYYSKYFHFPLFRFLYIILHYHLYILYYFRLLLYLLDLYTS